MFTIAQEMKALAQPLLRGDYSNADHNYCVQQDIGAYTRAEHQRWSVLFAHQKQAACKYASSVYFEALTRLESVVPLHQGIPCLSDLNPTLLSHTGWKLVAVPGLIPNDVFFAHLAKRQFPVTTWIRQAHEMDYIVEPDIFHDFFGHVPLLLETSIANFLQGYGEKAGYADQVAVTKLARLYWYMIEYGLIREGNNIKAFGAGLLTSRTELEHSIQTIDKHHQFNVEKIHATDYAIDSFQTGYFVLSQFKDLLGLNSLCLTDKLNGLID
jgi:phenylalanine-4-hydroxylase